MTLDIARQTYNEYIKTNKRLSNEKLIGLGEMLKKYNMELLDSLSAVLKAEYYHLYSEYIRIKTIYELKEKEANKLKRKYYFFKNKSKRRLKELDILLQEEKDIEEITLWMANIISVGEMLNIAYSQKNEGYFIL